jgi:membrane protease YdiL (CAAX protease family)
MTRSPGTRRRLVSLAASSAGLVLWGNVVVPRLPAGPVVRAAVNAAGAAAALSVALGRGYGRRELGLAPPAWTAGARLGGPAAGAVLGALAVLLTTSHGRAALAAGAQDRTALRAGLTIPGGTVLAEEVAFRGVLQAMAERRLPPRDAMAWCATTFSLWHFAGAVRSRSGPSAGVLVDLLATGAAGVVLGLLRRRSGSVLAPVLLHLATNSGGLVAAAIAARAGRYAGGIASTGRASTTVS